MNTKKQRNTEIHHRKLKMKNQFIINTFLILTFSVLIASCDNSRQNAKVNSQSNDHEEVQTIDGKYSYTDNSVALEITISGNIWTGKTMMISGFGSDYDSQNAQFDNGIIKDNNLYESSGMVKVGYVNGDYLTTSVAEQSVTLRKTKD